MNCRDIMIDLETMGKKVNAPIIQIGAVAFDRDTGEIGAEFIHNIDFDSALKHGVADGDTIRWWMQQGDEARASVTAQPASRLKSVLCKGLFVFYSDVLDKMRAVDPFNDALPAVWGCGATFDIAKLEYQYEVQFDTAAPWPFNAARDTRTVEDLSTLTRQEALDISNWDEFGGTHHDALSDAMYQVAYLVPMLRQLTGAKS